MTPDGSGSSARRAAQRGGTEDFARGEVLGIGLLILSFPTAAMSYRRWALIETAMRLEQPLPPASRTACGP